MEYQRSNRELWLSFIAVIFATLAYLFIVAWSGAVPHASEFYGHSLGVLGFIMMLMTETLYTLRKRSRSAVWGRMADWLNFHIFTGIVGPFLVLLHTSWKFNGLAGVLMLLTVVVVASGFIGRYIYTAVPRTADGVEIEQAHLEAQIRLANDELQRWLYKADAPIRQMTRSLPEPAPISNNWLTLVLGRTVDDWKNRRSWQNATGKLMPSQRAQVESLERLVERRRLLQRQLASIAAVRRLLGLWHAVHVPIGMVLFTAAIIHAVAAIYYATFFR